MPKHDTHLQEKIEVSNQPSLQEPPRYKVLLHNDDYTTMDFVVLILEKVFHKDKEEATRIMLDVHHQGLGVAGVYVFEIAETKAHTVHKLAKKNHFPLHCSLEKYL